MTMKKLTADDPETRSPDLVAENLERLKALFPELVTEGPGGTSVNVDVLKSLVGDKTVTDADEKYGLNWHGRRRARQLALTPSAGTLRPCPQDSLDWDTTQNLMIEGDNLEVLKLLQKSYAGKVKLIYIDPPYNTGKDFVYPDDFHDSIKNYQELTGQLEGGARITSNTEVSGRFHTDWLNMIYPRIKVAHALLRKDGIVFISIDDNEVDNLRKVCDEIFGEENRLAIICHKARASVSNDKIISSNHNFILTYARNINSVYDQRALFGLAPQLQGFDRNDARGPFKYVPVDGPGGAAKGNPYYTFLGVSGYWRYSEARMTQMFQDGRIEKVGSGLQQKYYLEDARDSRKTDTTWWDDNLYTATASSRLKELMGGAAFDNPKPVELLERIIQLWARAPRDLIVDFFAGSGTTAHAVMNENATDDGSRRFILVQLPEPLDPDNKDQAVAADFCDRLGRPRNIAELTKERLRLAARKIRDTNPMYAGDLGFRVFRLDSSNIQAWDPDHDGLEKGLLDSVDHIKVGRNVSDVLYELLLKLGLDLCVPIESRKIQGMEVQSIGGGVLIACLAEQIERGDVESLGLGIVDWYKQLAPAGDTTCVFRDSAFTDDVAKINLAALLEQNGIANVRSI
jgi:adenine-specific DNA-methyltransferase